MGGIFLYIHLLKLGITFILGYLFIKWFPDIQPIYFSEFVIQLILNPIEFFFGSIALMMGLIIQGGLLKVEFRSLFTAFKGKWQSPILLIPIHMITLYGLTLFGEWQTFVFSVLAFIYGIISLDLHGRGGQHG
jgi:hypothetical protein